MLTPVVVDELDASESLNTYKRLMTYQYDITVKEGKIGDNRALLLTRPKTPDSACAVHDECSIVVVDEKHNLVAKSIDRLYPYGHKYCTLKFHDAPPGAEEPVYVEEKLSGIHVTFTKVANTHLISTEKDLHAQDILPGTGKTVADFFVREMNKLHPISALDTLFNEAWFNIYCWIFQIVPVKHNLYELVLLSAIDIDSYKELPKNQVDNIASYFQFKRPEKVTIYAENQIDTAKDVLLKRNPTLKGVILRNNDNCRAKIIFNAKEFLSTYKKGTKKELLYLASCALHNININNPLSYVLSKNLTRLKREVGDLIEINKGCRTRKRFAERVSHHPLAKVLFALSDNKIEIVEELYKILTPYELIRTVIKVDGEVFIKAIDDYRNEYDTKTSNMV